jgi:HlyD family secretion protein
VAGRAFARTRRRWEAAWGRAFAYRARWKRRGQIAQPARLTEEAVAQRQAALHSAEINLGYTDILAPLDGTVVSCNVDLGQTVAAGSEGVPLFLIGTDLTIMQVNANVRENDIGKVKLGDKASFMVESISNHTFDGEVVQIRRSTRENATTSEVVISASNRELLLQSGMKATVQILVEKRDTILWCIRACVKAGSGTTLPGRPSRLWVLRDGKPTAITVRLDLADTTYTVVVKGDGQSGDELIIGDDWGIRKR